MKYWYPQPEINHINEKLLLRGGLYKLWFYIQIWEGANPSGQRLPPMHAFVTWKGDGKITLNPLFGGSSPRRQVKASWACGLVWRGCFQFLGSRCGRTDLETPWKIWWGNSRVLLAYSTPRVLCAAENLAGRFCREHRDHLDNIEK